MTENPTDRRPFGALPSLLIVLAVLGCWIELRTSGAGMADDVQSMRTSVAEQTRLLDALQAEMTLFRIERSVEGQGIAALLEKLSTYAPLLSTARTTKPDYDNARAEMKNILRAVSSLGRDAFEPILAEFRAIEPGEDFDKRKWLLEAAVRADPERGKDLVGKVLRGYDPEVPTEARLRWYAADMLLRIDKQLAGALLHDIMSFESASGLNRSRMPGGGSNVGAMDPGASSGFNNFISRFLTSDHPGIEDMLIMILGRPDHDMITKQECVKALGNLGSRKAVKAIEEVYENPPAYSQNALFLNRCLTALDQILGAEAKPFFEKALQSAQHPLVRSHLEMLLKKYK